VIGLIVLIAIFGFFVIKRNRNKKKESDTILSFSNVNSSVEIIK
jgi:hypothetical protein